MKFQIKSVTPQGDIRTLMVVVDIPYHAYERKLTDWQSADSSLFGLNTQDCNDFKITSHPV
ncbi:MAG: hypothetical protein AUJ88_03170 [Gallionellaceae bacterium CG1_02_56_997]|nr:MAG: hypothetical protein AUJ88_03170 [Gallionellaceae bacterium CG1_02_56_997]PIV15171.1 MAG: hypothetical protein COS43_03735 [Gallionellales bacterium CG03_land_8_20_14_0_80_55_15]PIX04756.1 MAG: hypothetical protein COZ77_04845 [Gallionellales bacterium CG_4_8_14_3_um_filter_54_18]HCJ51558.1 hypothetical protein [Gallionella sp.]